MHIVQGAGDNGAQARFEDIRIWVVVFCSVLYLFPDAKLVIIVIIDGRFCFAPALCAMTMLASRSLPRGKRTFLFVAGYEKSWFFRKKGVPLHLCLESNNYR